MDAVSVFCVLGRSLACLLVVESYYSKFGLLFGVQQLFTYTKSWNRAQEKMQVEERAQQDENGDCF